MFFRYFLRFIIDKKLVLFDNNKMAGKKRGKIDGNSIYRQVGFPADLFSKIEKEAEKSGVSLPEMVRDIVTNYYVDTDKKNIKTLSTDELIDELKRRTEKQEDSTQKGEDTATAI